jgi:predicted aminopeptidase
MLRQDPARLVETVIHELVHANIYATSKADFNESIATFIGEEARVAFFAEKEGSDAGARERRRVQNSRAYRQTLEVTRQEIAALYAESGDTTTLESRRHVLERRARSRIAALDGFVDSTAAAQKARLNDACLALAGTYGAHIARYETLTAERGLALWEFIRVAREAAEADEPLTALPSGP